MNYFHTEGTKATKATKGTEGTEGTEGRKGPTDCKTEKQGGRPLRLFASFRPNPGCLVFSNCFEYTFEKLITVCLMPTPNHHKIVLRINPDRVAAVAKRRKTRSRR